jgi:hypothetical protein
MFRLENVSDRLGRAGRRDYRYTPLPKCERMPCESNELFLVKLWIMTLCTAETGSQCSVQPHIGGEWLLKRNRVAKVGVFSARMFVNVLAE